MWLDAARREAGADLRPGADLETVAAIVGVASPDLRFNQRLLEAALENMTQGISVVDRDLRLVAWNRRYQELFGYPAGLLRVGMPIAEASAWALRHVAALADAGSDAALQRRLAHMRAGSSHLSERVFPDGSIIEIRGNPMPGGGFVATFTDVTAFRQAEAQLKRSNETLEQRVVERTALLESAKREAEHANDAKSRFLAAIGHDLLQPLHAAHLFADALAQRGAGEQRELARQIGGALDDTTDLLTTLLDMSRLEAGGLLPEPRDVPLADVLDPLVAQFGVIAAERGLRLRHVPTRAWVRTDPQLLRRVLQNFLANALRYTERGSVLLGVRRVGEGLRIEVHDTGPGIEADQRERIFEEFRRGEDAPGQGLGLGLAIADRIARLLGSQVALRSTPGAGSRFSVEVPRARASALPLPASQGLDGLHVLVVDNEPEALAALAAVLRGWGCIVSAVADGAAAEAVLARGDCALWIFDYHLDHGDDGVALHARLAARGVAAPSLILSADQTGAVRVAAQEAGLPLLVKPMRPGGATTTAPGGWGRRGGGGVAGGVHAPAPGGAHGGERAAAGRARAAPRLARVTAQQLHQRARLGRTLAGVDFADHLVLQPLVQHLEHQRVHRAAHGGDLHQQLVARDAGLQRALERGDLAGDPAHAGQELLVVAVHVDHGKGLGEGRRIAPRGDPG